MGKKLQKRGGMGNCAKNFDGGLFTLKPSRYKGVEVFMRR